MNLNFEDFNYSAYNATYTLSNAFERVFQALSMDHPELIYYSPASNSFFFIIDSKLINFSFTYSLSQEESAAPEESGLLLSIPKRRAEAHQPAA